MSQIRLDKFISSQLTISRKDAKLLLKKQSVTVNDAVITKADSSVDCDKDRICVNGKEISFKSHLYIMLNKPKGVVSATSDTSDITVVDILPAKLKRKGMFPAGRLDKDTTGFVLVTDDGEFAHDILSPAHHVKKTYTVQVARSVSDDEFKRFFDGMKVGDDIFKPAELSFINESDGMFNYEIKIVEGKYHQIKRMFASTGNPVINLHRTAIGGLLLDEKLLPGESREISDEELQKIKA